MVDLVDKGEAELQQLTQKVSMGASSATMRASVRVGKGVAAAPFKAVAAIFRTVQMSVNRERERGQLTLKNFTKVAEGKRSVLNIDDRAVSKQLERELRKYGVLWSVESHRDGSRTFHVQGKDAELVQHALTVAAERVDEKLARNAPELAASNQQSGELGDEVPVLEQDKPESIPRLVDHGSAPYQHQEGGSPSYFVTIERDDVRQTLWGVDLERAVSVSGAELGDGIKIENIGSQPVTLPDGTHTHRNSWEVEVTDAPQRQQQQLPDAPTHGADELREDAPTQSAAELSDDAPRIESAERSETRSTPESAEPERVAPQRDEPVTERGGQSVAQEPALTRSDQRPEQTARDRTRGHAAAKIDKDVTQRKSELSQTRTRTKKRTPTRDANTAAQPNKTTRR